MFLPDNYRLLRNEVVRLTCLSGSDACLDAAAAEIQSWILDPNYPLPLDTRRQVLLLWKDKFSSGRFFSDMVRVLLFRPNVQSCATDCGNISFIFSRKLEVALAPQLDLLMTEFFIA